MNVFMCNACKLFNKDLNYCAFSMYIGDVCPNFTPNWVDVHPAKRGKWITKAGDYYKAWGDSGIRDESASEKNSKNRPKCYFCGGDCYSNTTVTINCANLNQSELFKVYVCGECAESVKSALILLRAIRKEENK